MLFPFSILPGESRYVGVVSLTKWCLKLVFILDSNHKSVKQSPIHCIVSSEGPLLACLDACFTCSAQGTGK